MKKEPSLTKFQSGDGECAHGFPGWENRFTPYCARKVGCTDPLRILMDQTWMLNCSANLCHHGEVQVPGSWQPKPSAECLF